MSDIEDTKIYRALTADEFNLGVGYTYRGIGVVEDEDANWVFGYGHPNKHSFAAAVNDYDHEMTGDASLTKYTARDVQHRYAVTLKPHDDPDGWFITWADEHQNHPDRFPVTVVNR